MQMKTGTDTVSCQKQQPESDAGGSSAQLPAESIYIFQCGVHNVKLLYPAVTMKDLKNQNTVSAKLLYHSAVHFHQWRVTKYI